MKILLKNNNNSIALLGNVLELYCNQITNMLIKFKSDKQKDHPTNKTIIKNACDMKNVGAEIQNKNLELGICMINSRKKCCYF